jgi:hypothetical protein
MVAGLNVNEAVLVIVQVILKPVNEYIDRAVIRVNFFILFIINFS